MTTTKKTITQAGVEALRKAGHAAILYPRKGIVVVDGYKQFKLQTKKPN